MVGLDPHESTMLAAAMMRSRAVFVSGPRHSGMSTSVSRVVSQAGNLEVTLRPIEVVSDAELMAYFEKRFNRSDKMFDGLASVATAIAEHYAGREITLLIHDTHALPDSVLKKLLELSLDSGSPFSDRLCFVFEGALDFELEVIPRFFPGGTPADFQSFVLQRGCGFALFPSMCLYISAVRGGDNKLLAAWMADITGGHVVLARSASSLLPSDEFLKEATLLAVFKKLCGRSEVRNCLKFLDNLNEVDRPLLTDLSSGKVVPGPPAQLLELGTLRQLTIHGIVVFHPGLQGYRLVSPIFASILVERFGLSCLPISDSDMIEARLGFLFSYICAVELHLRERLLSLSDLESFLAKVNVEPPHASGIKVLNKALSCSGDIPEQYKASFRKLLDTHLPPKRSLSNTPVAKLSFNELLQVALKANIISGSLLADFERVRDLRNDLAHFRAPSFEGAKLLMDLSKRILHPG